jgi:signal transduction histidine kinase
VHPEDSAARERAIEHAVETRGEYEAEYRVLGPDGAVRWMNGRGRCVGPGDGTGLKLFGVSMDVTARKRAEALAAREREELQHKRAQLEHVARVATLGELTATLTHELKQPLNAILVNSFVGVKLLDAPQPDLPAVRETFADVREIAQRADQVIRGLRDLLKPDAQELTRVDANDVVRTVERIVHGDAVQHKVKVQLELSPGPFPVEGNAVQLQQVMLNLMLNAFSAMGGPGGDGARRLVVRTNPVNGSDVLVEVQDSGTGIAADKLERIFEPFVTSKPDGLGMGLSICRSIIERHGGRLWAANNPDRGATFSITLPVTREPGPVAHATPPAPSPLYAGDRSA